MSQMDYLHYLLTRNLRLELGRVLTLSLSTIR
jgi:hypothetical protein